MLIIWWFTSAIFLQKNTAAYPKPIENTKTLLLDDEWDYDYSSRRNFQLPQYLDKIYNDFDENPAEYGEIRIFFNKARNSSNNYFSFNLTQSPTKKTILQDVHLYFYLELGDYPNFNLSKWDELKLYEIIDVTNYQLHEKQKLLNVIYVERMENGWHSFQLANISKTNRFLITISGFKTDLELVKDNRNDHLQSFLMAKWMATHKRMREEVAFAGPNANCTKANFYVDFHRFNWDRFILKPSGFEAGQCIGNCSENRRFLYEKMCCIPISYNDLPVMFLDQYSDIVLKRYSGLIIEKCRCQ